MNYRTFLTPSFSCLALYLLCSYDRPQKKDALAKIIKETGPYDVIIVPGVPYLNPSYKLLMKARILWAKYLYDRKFTKNIIFSGSSVYTPYVEGQIMKMYADSIGVPPSHTYSEVEAEHSTENIYYSMLMAKRMGFKRVAVATDQYQAVIINRYIKKMFPELKIIPIQYDKIKVRTAPWPAIDASCAFNESFVSLVKRENRAKRFQGTLGKNISYPQNDSILHQKRDPVFVTF
jgi:hypothetical protein